MKAYNGGSISNLIKWFDHKSIWVTDDIAKAARYANAQASGVVSSDYAGQAEGTVVLEVACNPCWSRRPVQHASLDQCEDQVTEYAIVKATVRFREYPKTLYGPDCLSASQVVEFLSGRGIEVVVR